MNEVEKDLKAALTVSGANAIDRGSTIGQNAMSQIGSVAKEQVDQAK